MYQMYQCSLQLSFECLLTLRKTAFAWNMQGVMRHIQALLYRSLRHKLLQGRATAPLAKRHPVGPDAAAVVDAAVGDIYGEVSL